MANGTFLSPGVYTREIDLSYIPAEIPAVGAAIIGPTVRGRALVPTPISTYSEYLRWFGDKFSSGSGADEKEYKYLTTHAVQEYLRWGELCHVVRILAGNYTPAYSNIESTSSFGNTSSFDPSFKLYALTDGEITNSGQLSAAVSGSGITTDENSNGVLVSGSSYNIRWEVLNVDEDRGIFDLLIRRGDDSLTRKTVLEQYVGISLDPNSPNYITNVIGDETYTLRYDSNGLPYLEQSGSYPIRSRFVRAEVLKTTLNYIDANGNVRDGSLSGSLPAAVSGTFAGGSDGNVSHPRAMNEKIWNNNTQGFNLAVDASGSTAYQDAIDVLSNKDFYDFDLLFTPGLIDNLAAHSTLITRAISMVEDRGDAMYVIDPTYKGSTVGQAQIAAEGRNTNYAAYYYPWVLIPDNDLGRSVWVPPSAVIPAVYSFNDKVGEKWYAPAGLNRGGLDTALKTERVMTQGDRDNLYRKSVNPLATFPREGIVVWGQKTLQKKSSALDRINVRRLLIAAKRHVANTSRYLVFEQNSEETRARFLEITEPWFRNAKQKQGVYEFKIKMDRENNTPDVIDRNEMRAQIWLKPTKTAEKIIVDFIILPTGAEFPIDSLD